MARDRWDSVSELRKLVRDDLFRIPGVCAVGARRKETNGMPLDQPAISVYVERKRALRDLGASERIPKELNGCPTDVFATIPPHTTAGEFDAMDVKFPELIGGIAIEADKGPGVATLGCLATVAPASGSAFPVALTCQHVLSMSLGSGVDVGSVVGQPALSSWCSQTFSKGNIIGTCLWGANTGELAPTVVLPGVDAGAVRLNAGQKYRQAIFKLLKSASTPNGFTTATNGIHDVVLNDIKDGTYSVHMVGYTTYPKRGTSHGVVIDICDCKVMRQDEKFYYYQDCLQIIRPDHAHFSENADSGAALVDNLRRVVGIVFSGSPSELLEAQLGTAGSAFNSEGWQVIPPPPRSLGGRPAPGSWACKIKHIIDRFHADTGMTLSIPVGVEDEILTAAGVPDTEGLALNAEQAAALELARKRFRETEAGREIFAVFRSRQREIRQLVNSNRRVATAWHRIGGPSIAFMILDAAEHPHRPVPTHIGDYPLKEGLDALKQQLLRYGSSELRRDMEIVAPMIESLPGSTLNRIIASLERHSESSRL